MVVLFILSIFLCVLWGSKGEGCDGISDAQKVVKSVIWMLLDKWVKALVKWRKDLDVIIFFILSL